MNPAQEAQVLIFNAVILGMGLVPAVPGKHLHPCGAHV